MPPPPRRAPTTAPDDGRHHHGRRPRTAATTTEPATTTTEATTTTDEATTTTEEATTTTEETTTTHGADDAQLDPGHPGAARRRVPERPRAFAEAWNQAGVGHHGAPDQQQRRAPRSQTGPEADTFVVYLSRRASACSAWSATPTRPWPQVIVVWVPGGDQTASATMFYHDAFDVLTQTLSPDLDEAARAELATSLGLSATTPPFPARHQHHRDRRRRSGTRR